MQKKDSRVDIRIVKYKNYIKKHPQKPYGYYCLGQLNILASRYKDAEKYFAKALLLDNNYTYAKVGLIKALIYRKKVLKAVHLYNKYNDEINQKKVFVNKLVRGISSCWGKKELDGKKQGLFSAIYFKYVVQVLNNLFNSQIDNLVLNLVLCIYYLSREDKTDKALVVYNNCVKLDGLTDKMRWALVKALSTANPAIYKDSEIAGKFSKVPVPNCPSAYANKIFEVFLRQGKIKKAKAVFEDIENPDKVISQSNLWEYVNLCTKNSYYDISVYMCCSRLLKAGWINNVLAHALRKIKELNIVSDTKQEEKVLKLFGYLS